MSIDDIRFGNCMPPHDAMNLARNCALLAGIPETVTAVTVNRVCISGMEATISGMAQIQAGLSDIILSGGVEHMSGVAYAVNKARWGCRLQNTSFDDMLIEGLMCGTRLLPHPEDGPVKDGIMDKFIGLTPIAKIKAVGYGGCHPSVIGSWYHLFMP